MARRIRRFGETKGTREPEEGQRKRGLGTCPAREKVSAYATFHHPYCCRPTPFQSPAGRSRGRLARTSEPAPPRQGQPHTRLGFAWAPRSCRCGERESPGRFASSAGERARETGAGTAATCHQHPALSAPRAPRDPVHRTAGSTASRSPRHLLRHRCAWLAELAIDPPSPSPLDRDRELSGVVLGNARETLAKIGICPGRGGDAEPGGDAQGHRLQAGGT